jgi:hypothetical protein
MTPQTTITPIWSPRRVHLLIDPDKWQLDELDFLLRSVPEIVGSVIDLSSFGPL